MLCFEKKKRSSRLSALFEECPKLPHLFSAPDTLSLHNITLMRTCTFHNYLQLDGKFSGPTYMSCHSTSLQFIVMHLLAAFRNNLALTLKLLNNLIQTGTSCTSRLTTN